MDKNAYKILEMPPYLSITQASKYVPISPRNIRELILKNKLKAKKMLFVVNAKRSVGKYIFKTKDLLDLIEEMPNLKAVNPDEVTVS